MTCAYCSTELPEGAMFCGECGRAVSTKPAKQGAKTAAAAVPETVPDTLILEPEPEPEPEPVAEPVPEPDVEPEALIVPAPPTTPAAVTPPASVPAAQAVGQNPSERAETCAQCGTELEASDIFCPECGFVRQSVAARSRLGDTAVLDPFPWGLPRATESATTGMPSFADKTADEGNADPGDGYNLADIDETRIVDRTPHGERFVLQFSTGESVRISGTGLVGRNPIAEPGEYFDSMVTIVDPGKSVSKTHLEFGQDGGTFWISDRFSGNGTVLREPDRDAKRCEAGKRYRVSRGARVDIGEQFFIVS